MKSTHKAGLVVIACALSAFACLAAASRAAAAAEPQQLPPPRGPRELQIVGVVKSITGRMLTVAADTTSPDKGSPDKPASISITVLIPEIVTVISVEPPRPAPAAAGSPKAGDAEEPRVDPSQIDLKTARPLYLADVRIDDHVVLRGGLSDDGSSVVATLLMVLRHPVIHPEQHTDFNDPQLLLDWQKRGVHGVVSVVEPDREIVRISAVSASGPQAVAIHVNKDTVVRRYAPGSVKLEDAVPGNFAQIKPGDQVQARGARSMDGRDITADEIISGPATP